LGSRTARLPTEATNRNDFSAVGIIGMQEGSAGDPRPYADQMLLTGAGSGHRVCTIVYELEAFNVFNHTEFDNVDTTNYDTVYGDVTSAYAPRIVEIALRLTF
jgi:hypothetical protein